MGGSEKKQNRLRRERDQRRGAWCTDLEDWVGGRKHFDRLEKLQFAKQNSLFRGGRGRTKGGGGSARREVENRRKVR